MQPMPDLPDLLEQPVLTPAQRAVARQLAQPLPHPGPWEARQWAPDFVRELERRRALLHRVAAA